MQRLARYLSHPQVLIEPSKSTTEWSLDHLGKKRVADLAKSGALAGTQRIVSSTETKAIETASPLAESLGCCLEIRENMHENDRSATGFCRQMSLRLLQIISSRILIRASVDGRLPERPNPELSQRCGRACIKIRLGTYYSWGMAGSEPFCFATLPTTISAVHMIKVQAAAFVLNSRMCNATPLHDGNLWRA